MKLQKLYSSFTVFVNRSRENAVQIAKNLREINPIVNIDATEMDRQLAGMVTFVPECKVPGSIYRLVFGLVNQQLSQAAAAARQKRQPKRKKKK